MERRRTPPRRGVSDKRESAVTLWKERGKHFFVTSRDVPGFQGSQTLPDENCSRLSVHFRAPRLPGASGTFRICLPHRCGRRPGKNSGLRLHADDACTSRSGGATDTFPQGTTWTSSLTGLVGSLEAAPARKRGGRFVFKPRAWQLVAPQSRANQNTDSALALSNTIQAQPPARPRRKMFFTSFRPFSTVSCRSESKWLRFESVRKLTNRGSRNRPRPSRRIPKRSVGRWQRWIR
jgi:hypothetical protein